MSRPKTALPATASAPTPGRSYWRSLERRLDLPAGKPSPEFAEGADLPPDAMSRRTMMSLMGASMALAGLAGCRRPVEKILPYVQAPENVIPGIPKHYATTFELGTSAYGVVVESHEGRPNKIEGNELHPSSGGAASAWMQASILDLYDPDRLAAVRRNAAGAEDGAADAPATWEEVVAFIGERRAELAASSGAGLAVLTPGSTSPTLARLRRELLAQWPAARWVAYEPFGDSAVFAGVALATGTPLRPLYHLDKAKVIVALDADLLGTESESLRHARGYAAGRRGAGRKVESAEGSMSRLYAVESTLTLTGARSDHRLRLKSSEIPGFAAALAAALGVGAASASLPAAAQSRLSLIARDLRAVGSAGLVVAGRNQPPAVHALALAINRALGALGTTVTLHELTDVSWGGEDGLRELLAAIDAGSVTTLFVLGGNPAHGAPADLDLTAVLAKVPHRLYVGVERNETAELCTWNVPGTHFLEMWGDARAADDTLSVVQPLIAPLYGGKSALEIAALLKDGTEQPGYELVRATWQQILPAESFEAGWRTVLHDGVLHDGVLAGSAAAPAGAEVDGAAAGRALAALPAPESGLELTFHLSANVYDGRYANNAWLQELPNPLTRICWNNAAFVSPKTASELGVESGQVVSLSYRGRSLEAPVWVLAGQADGSVALALGYGRTAAGRVGNGVGVNAIVLRDSAAPWGGPGLALSTTGERRRLVQTQEHSSMEGRPLVREATLAEYRENPGFARAPDHDFGDQQLFPDHDYSQGPQWGMSIDLGTCTGCNACVIACQAENNIPVVGPEQIAVSREMHWLRIDRYFVGDENDPQVAFQPIPCMHCENAPCEQVCPVAATVHDQDGINAMVYNRCIGTRYCSNNCPYKVRRFNFFNYTKDTPELTKMVMNPDVTVRSRGVMEKCTYCVQRISEARIQAKREGRRALVDGEIKTACQQTCAAQAISFGDIRDEKSAVARRKQSELDYVLLGELNNRPRTSYLARLRNPNPEWETA